MPRRTAPPPEAPLRVSHAEGFCAVKTATGAACETREHTLCSGVGAEAGVRLPSRRAATSEMLTEAVGRPLGGNRGAFCTLTFLSIFPEHIKHVN